MRNLTRLFSLLALGMVFSGFSPCTQCSTDNPPDERDVGEAPRRPWYHCHDNFMRDSDSEIGLEADELQDDTSWAGQRQDFSDVFFR